MSKIHIVTAIIIILMLIPAINMVMDNDDQELNAFTVETELFGEYLADKPIRTSETTISFYGSFGSGHNIDPSTITRIDADHDYLGWYYDIENESQFTWSYISSTNSVNLSFDDGYGVVYLNIKGNGTFYNEYWSQAFGETKIYCDGLNEDDVLFYATIFYNDPDIEYSEINSYDEREIGMTYNGNDDSNGYSAIDIGTAMFTDGLFGMLPRKNSNDRWEFPLLGHVKNSASIVGDMLLDGIANILEPPVITTANDTFYTIGNWNEDVDAFPEDIYYYVVDEPTWGFGGLMIKATVLSAETVYYQRYNMKLGFWLPQLWNRNITNSEMEDYQTETNNFE
jgi:hypothetical protein